MPVMPAWLVGYSSAHITCLLGTWASRCPCHTLSANAPREPAARGRGGCPCGCSISCLVRDAGLCHDITLGPLPQWTPSHREASTGRVTQFLGGGGRSGTTKGKQVTPQAQHIRTHQIKNWRAESSLDFKSPAVKGREAGHHCLRRVSCSSCY